MTTTMGNTKNALVPKLRFKGFEQFWLSRELNTCVSLVSGYPFQSESFSDYGSKLMTPKNFTKYGHAYFDAKNTKYTTESVDSKYICKCGDLLVLLTDLTPTCELLGKPVILNETDGFVLLNQRIVKIIEDTNIIDKPFLSNLFQTYTFHKRIKETATGTTVRHSSNKILLSYITKFPTLPEQQKIASFFTAVDDKIRQLTRKKELLEQYKKGVMQQLFSGKLRFNDDKGKAFAEWEEKRLGDVCDLKNGFAFKSSTYHENGEFNLVTIKNVQGGLMVGPFTRLNSLPKNLESHQILRIGDILISMTGNVGRVCHVIYENCILNQRVGKLEPNGIDSDYLYHLVNNDNFLDAMIKAGQGAAQLNIGKKDILEYGLIIATAKAEQQKIATYLSAIDSKLERVSGQIDQSQTFKKGLLQQMFV